MLPDDDATQLPGKPPPDGDATLPLGGALPAGAGPFPGPASPAPAAERPGDEVGPYRLASLLGEGAFGEVWLAERRRPFVQRVALKVLKPGMDSKAVLARFEQERQALAVMNHPGIAKVLDGGLTPRGRPYFAMEYVKGEPITEFCDRVKLSIEDRLRLFEQVCEAVQHAHLRGIVHRDIKPSNVLAFMVEGEAPKVKVIDFGVAKAMSQPLTQRSIFTETGVMVGTPEYMSPEQADPTVGDIDTRSDIYSLGVLLYEMLVGATPFDGRDLRSRAIGEMQRAIRELDPPTPSVRLSTLCTSDPEAAKRIEAARHSRKEDLVRRLRGELEWIPLKAMRKEPQHRYQAPLELARDVRNYLEGKPLMAAPESAAYRMRKYARRNRALVAGAGAVLAALLLGFVATAWQYRSAVRERDAAELARSEALEQRDAATAAERQAHAERERARDLLGVITAGSALDAVRAGDLRLANRDLALLREIGRAGRFPDRLAAALGDRSIARLGVEGPAAIGVAFSPAGNVLASAGADGLIRLWDPNTGQQVGRPFEGHSGGIADIAFSPDGKMIASASIDSTVRLWDAASGRQLGAPLMGHTREVLSVAFSPDGRLLASGSKDGTARLWDVGSGASVSKPLKVSHGWVQAVAFSPDGSMVVGACGDSISRWDVSSGRAVGDPLQISIGGALDLAFSPDGRMIAVAGGGGVSLRDPATGERLGEDLQGMGAVSVAFSPDGTLLAATSIDEAVVAVWDVQSRRQIAHPLRGHPCTIFGLCFGPDSKLLATAGADGVIRLWDALAVERIDEPLRGHQRAVGMIAASPDGRVIVSAGSDGIRSWDVVSGKQLGEPLRCHAEATACAAMNRDGRLVASASPDRTVRIWDLAASREVAGPLKGHEDRVTSVTFSADGKFLASGGADGLVLVWDVATGARVGAPLRGHRRSVGHVKVLFSPDGTVLASSGGGEIRLWEPVTGKELGVFGVEGGISGDLAFSPDGRLLAGAIGGAIQLWDVATREPRGEPMQAAEMITCISFSPDGTSIASAGYDGTVRLWDVATGKPLGEPLGVRENGVSVVAFSPDGLSLISAGIDNTIRVWSAMPMGERRAALRAREHQVWEVRSMLGLEGASGTAATPADLDARVRADPRFAGELRTAALIVAGEASLERQRADAAVRTRPDAGIDAAQDDRLKLLEESYRKRDWAAVLTQVSTMPDGDLEHMPAGFWNEIAWLGLTELPADSPARDLLQLLRYAERAAELSDPKDANILDTLARVHWELGNKPLAIEVQREAIKASSKAMGREPSQDEADLHAELEATLSRYESLPARSALPKPVAPAAPQP